MLERSKWWKLKGIKYDLSFFFLHYWHGHSRLVKKVSLSHFPGESIRFQSLRTRATISVTARASAATDCGAHDRPQKAYLFRDSCPEVRHQLRDPVTTARRAFSLGFYLCSPSPKGSSAYLRGGVVVFRTAVTPSQPRNLPSQSRFREIL